MMGWMVVAALGLVIVAGLWRLYVGLQRLTAQLAVLTVVTHDVLDKIVDLDTELHAVDDRLK
jgi:hypothetical protein